MPIGVYEHKPLPPEVRKKISEAQKKIKHAGHFGKGSTPWNKGLKGIHLSPNSEWKKGQTPEGSITFKKGEFADEKHKNWRGDKVSYSGLHYWISRKLGKPMVCSHCETTTAKKYEWANISGQYLRDLTDWVRLCVSCHRKMDGHSQKAWQTRRAYL